MIRAFLFFILIITLACREQPAPLKKISSPGKIARSVYLTQDNKNNPVIAWTEKSPPDDHVYFFYAVAAPGDDDFSEKINIPVPGAISTHAEGMPKVAFRKDGTVVAAYESAAPTPENKWASAVYYIQSTDSGKTWSDPGYVHSDTVAGRSRSFFDMATLPDGSVGAAWLDIKLNSESGGRSVRFAKMDSQDGFKQEILIDSSACECCRTDLLTDVSGNVDIAYRGMMRGKTGASIRDMMITTSTDGGSSFSLPLRISADNWAIEGCPHSGPGLSSNRKGIHALWYTGGNESGIYYAFAENAGENFSPREQIETRASHPQICSVDNKIAMVWEKTFSAGDRHSTRIQFQLREGLAVKNGFLSAEGANASFPVIIESKHGFLVGFLMEAEGGTGVYVTRIGLDKM